MSTSADSPAKTAALSKIAQIRKDAPELPRPGDDGGDDGGGAERKFTGGGRLPEGCPVRPLGINGDVCFYLDAAGQLREVKDERHTRLKIAHLFGSYAELLEDYWPRKTQDKETGEWTVTGWRPEVAAMQLTSACADLGVWSPFQKVRGRGAWLGPEGQLILHCGDKVFLGAPPGSGNRTRGEWIQPGVHDGYVYPTGPAIMRPARDPQPAGGNSGSPADEFLQLFGKWPFRRGEIDARLMLGLVVAQKLGGALKIRPVGWITAGYGGGKSTAQQAVKWLHGENAAIDATDPTSAGIWQAVRYDSLPVNLDEQESEEDNRKNFQLIKLARQAATGGVILRGGADHTGSSFTAKSCFLFSSILIPPLMPQDRSRMIIFEIGRLQKAADLKLTQKRMFDMGARLLRRAVDNWLHFQETFEVYHDALMQAGHIGRGADVFGAALACAHLVMHDGVPEAEEAAATAALLAAPTLAELEGNIPDELSCWQHLIATVIEPFRSGGRSTVGEWITKARGLAKTDDGKLLSVDQQDAANNVLQTYGLRLVDNTTLCKLYGAASLRDLPEGIAPPYLAVANSHPAVAKLFENTHWGGKSGASGVWVQALRRMEGAVSPPRPLWLSGGRDDHAIAGASHRVTLVPLQVASGQGAGDGSEQTSSSQGGERDDELPF
jgi:hypothetical protein